jgi:hypothetical protein
MTKKLKEFIKLMKGSNSLEHHIKTLNACIEKEVFYLNLFKDYANDEWYFSGFDTYSTLDECEKGEQHYLNMGNHKEEIIGCLKIKDLLKELQ